MTTFTLAPNIEDPDGFYNALIDAHDGLSTAQSEMLNAVLLVVLANQIGNPQTLRSAIRLAKTRLSPQI